MLEQVLSQLDTFPVLGINSLKYVPIDLSTKNLELLKVDIANASAFENYINHFLNSKNANVAYGGYNEPRNIYKRSKAFNVKNTEERFIHLGVDLWTKAETLIYAPFAGIVHSFANNKGLGNYGPTIILEHQLNGLKFYTLYGHLTIKSIENIVEGQQINKGEQFAAIGNYPLNGDYPPHLHFQLINDLKGMKGDFPGVTSLKDRKTDLENSVNPKLLIKL